MLRRSHFTFAPPPPLTFLAARKARESDLNKIPEILQANKFLNELRNNNGSIGSSQQQFLVKGGRTPKPLSDLTSQIPNFSKLSSKQQNEQIENVLKSAFATFTLHVESRIANAVQKGFYTIGPCGEELIAPIGLVLNQTDPCALHYRHLSVSISRRIASMTSSTSTTSSTFSSNDNSETNNHLKSVDQALEAILLDRARGYTVAATDPVCGGHHCCLGGGDSDFLVTSTLASQSCPALGRGMGIPLANKLLGVSRYDEKYLSSTQKKKNNNNSKEQEEEEEEEMLAAKFPHDAVSFVSLGDGSINNAHFLSAMNLADYVIHRNFKAPIVFCVTDNNICISLRGMQYVDRFLDNAGRFTTFEANGSDCVDTWIASHKAIESARKTGRPHLLVLRDITRRFGHAATDRQSAYMSQTEIQEWEDRNPLIGFCQTLVDAGLYSHKQLADIFENIWESTKKAFEEADQEPKIYSRAQVSKFNSAPLLKGDEMPKFLKKSTSNLLNGASIGQQGVAVFTAEQKSSTTRSSKKSSSSSSKKATSTESSSTSASTSSTSKKEKEKEKPSTKISPQMLSTFQNVYEGIINKKPTGKTQVMRKHMNKVFDEILSTQKDVVYIGEDVTHGGYYLVTDGLVKKHGPMRVMDFPPDETSLIGAGQGFSQCGLTPIVEIPYAKYLDCGFDAFTEACIMHWLSSGREANGLIFRLQGFGRGVFGGNYHTHNMIFIPPGLDVICCARGDDYMRMMRYSIQQARKGRMMMFVDPTELLNMREINRPMKSPSADVVHNNCWEFEYAPAGEYITLDDVTLYRSITPDVNIQQLIAAHDEKSSSSSTSNTSSATTKKKKSAVETSSSPSSSSDEQLTTASQYVKIVSENHNNQQIKQASKHTKSSSDSSSLFRKVAIVTYGNGLIATLEADLANNSTILELGFALQCDVIDCRCLSQVPLGLKEALYSTKYDAVLFADPCKFGNHPLSMHFSMFTNWAANGRSSGAKLLPVGKMKNIGAEFTYNPLGKTVTFLNANDIVDAVLPLLW